MPLSDCGSSGAPDEIYDFYECPFYIWLGPSRLRQFTSEAKWKVDFARVSILLYNSYELVFSWETTQNARDP